MPNSTKLMFNIQKHKKLVQLKTSKFSNPQVVEAATLMNLKKKKNYLMIFFYIQKMGSIFKQILHYRNIRNITK